MKYFVCCYVFMKHAFIRFLLCLKVGFPVVDVPKMAFVQAESTLSHKRKSSLGNSFQAKRARLNKITGKILFFVVDFFPFSCSGIYTLTHKVLK